MTAATPSLYQQRIAEIEPDLDPRHVEAYMRLEFGTLDHLSPERFAAEVRTAAACVRLCAVEGDDAEALAQSFGL